MTTRLTENEAAKMDIAWWLLQAKAAEYLFKTGITPLALSRRAGITRYEMTLVLRGRRTEHAESATKLRQFLEDEARREQDDDKPADRS